MGGGGGAVSSRFEEEDSQSRRRCGGLSFVCARALPTTLVTTLLFRTELNQPFEAAQDKEACVCYE